MTLEELRNRLSEIDRELLTLIAERQRLSRHVAEVKRATGHPTRDFRRERDVLLRARETATQLGLSAPLAETLLRMLIRESLTTQEQLQVAAGAKGSGRAALVIGGGGKMGGWFAEFLSSQGFRVEIADPAGAVRGKAQYADWREAELNHDLIVVATPIQIANDVLEGLASVKPRGVVFDIGSVKSPLRSGLAALQQAGVAVTSIHPMFGPDTELLSDRHVILIDLGSRDALRVAEELFVSTMAERIVMSLDEHDRLIAYVLGLSHAVNIAFFTALAESGEAAPRLQRLSSTTFDAQLNVASRVAAESPALYFEIQRLNDYGLESLAALRAAVERVQRTVAESDAQGFAALMERGREYLEGRNRER